MRLPLLFIPLLLIAGLAEAQPLLYENAFPNLTFTQPVAIEHAPDGHDRLYVVEQPGQIMVFDNDADVAAKSTFLDIRQRVDDVGWEKGLLGLAFHPDYAENGHFFVNYTASGPSRTVVSRFTRSTDNPLVADPDSELIIIQFSQPFGNHNGGDVAFGPDGYLYIATGDGGSGNDPQDHGLNTGTLLGAILRLDVDSGQGAAPDCGAGMNANYTIPDNAVADGPGGACDEIFAYGLRNPWRFSFDTNGDFWVADVGQVTREEINLVENGDNLGWRVYEGTHCTGLGSAHGPPCGDPIYKHPIWEYGFSGSQSITGGFVYRGEMAPELYGKYVYADFMTGHIWALSVVGVGGAENEELFNTNLSISTFGVDMHDQLYFAHRPDAANQGRVYAFRSEGVGTEPPVAVSAPELELAGPNPAGSQTAVAFVLPEAAEARLALYDLLGRRVADLYAAHTAAGERVTVPVPTAGLAAGTYVVSLGADGQRSANLRIVIAR